MPRSTVMKTIFDFSKLKHLKDLNARCISTSKYRQNIRDNILYSTKEIEIPNVSIPELVYSHIEPYSKFTAFECATTHRKITYGDLRIKSRNLSKVLRKKFGLNKGDVVLIHLQNCPEFPIAALGCMEAGLITSTSNSLYTADELAKQLKDSAAKLIITCSELYDNAAKAAAKLPSSKLPIICLKTKPEQSLPQGAIDFYEIVNTTVDIPDLVLPNSDDLAALPYSSGTTGLPKGVMLSHGNIVANLIQNKDPDIGIVQAPTGDVQEVVPGVLPMYHIYGFTINTFFLMMYGGKVFTLTKFQPDTYIEILKNHPVSLIFAAPPLVLFLTHHPGVKPEYLKTVRQIMCGAAPLGPLDEEKFLKKAGNHVFLFQGYGLTETAPVITVYTRTHKEKYGAASAGSVGQVLAQTEVKIVKHGDDTGTPLGPNEHGELLVRGPQVMQGYHNNPQATKDSFLDGWFKTGDLAYYDENEMIFITDRAKELIKVKGYQVAPAELEELLRNHPEVEDAAVIGIPHDLYGEVPRAYIRAKGDVQADELYKFVADKVAKYKKLDGGIEFVKEIPTSSAGKILRRQLKEKYLTENKA